MELQVERIQPSDFIQSYNVRLVNDSRLFLRFTSIRGLGERSALVNIIDFEKADDNIWI